MHQAFILHFYCDYIVKIYADLCYGGFVPFFE